MNCKLRQTACLFSLTLFSAGCIQAQTAPNPVFEGGLFKNGDFAAGDGTPQGWETPKEGGERGPFRDTAVFQSAPAALRLEPQDGKNARTSQTLKVGSASSFTLSGATRTTGTLRIRYDLQVFDNQWKQLAWISSQDNETNALKPSGEWRPFSRQVMLPEKAATAVFYLNAQGSGQLWLDDLRAVVARHADFNPAASKTIAQSAPVKVVGQQAYEWKNAVMGGVEFATNLIFNPKRPELMYSRNDTGGIYRFDRKAVRWIPLSDSIPWKWSQLFVADSFALDANNPNTIYVATGGGRWGNLHDVIKTIDGGKTWQRTHLKNAEGKDVFSDAGLDPKPPGERLACDPNDSRVVWFGSRSDGLFRSNDGAKTWKQAAFPAKGAHRQGFSFVTLDWKAGKNGTPTRVIYAGIQAGPITSDKDGPKAESAVFRSIDGGTTWKKLEAGPDGKSPDAKSSPMRGRVGIDGAFYVSYKDGAGFWKWKDDVWSDLTPPAGKGKTFTGIGIHPTDPLQLLTITTDPKIPIFYSRDGGKNWQNFQYQKGRPSNISIGFFPAWELAEENFKWPGGYCATIDFDPLDPTVAYETDFSGANKLTGIGTGQWRVDLLSAGREQITSGDVLSPSAGAPLVSGVWDVGGFRHENLDEVPKHRIILQKSDGSAYSGYDQYRNGYQDLFHLDANPHNPNHIVGAGGWQWNNTGDASLSTDNGKIFRVLTKPFEGAKFGRIAIGISPKNIIWAPMGDKNTPIFFSKDSGQSWTAAQGAPLGTIASDGPWTFYKLLAADRENDSWFYLYDRRDGHFYRSEDGGANWKHLSVLPTQPGNHYDIHKIQAAPDIGGEVWAALRDKGLFRSSDGGTTWTQINNVLWAQSLAFGKGKTGSKLPALYLFGQIGGTKPSDEREANVQLYRSDDLGATWTRINDDAHQFAGFNSIEGDKQMWGRVYMSTGGRGIFYGVPR